MTMEINIFFQKININKWCWWWNGLHWQQFWLNLWKRFHISILYLYCYWYLWIFCKESSLIRQSFVRCHSEAGGTSRRFLLIDKSWKHNPNKSWKHNPQQIFELWYPQILKRYLMDIFKIEFNNVFCLSDIEFSKYLSRCRNICREPKYLSTDGWKAPSKAQLWWFFARGWLSSYSSPDILL